MEVHRSTVERIRPRETGWQLESSCSDGRCYERSYDEVLVATGHEHRSEAGLGRSWRHAARLVPAVFPVDRYLTCGRVPTGATVAVRGFALSFIDAALALTEGRGGSFESLAHPYRLRYTPAVDQIGLMLPFSRTGRPMLAKPDPAMIEQLPDLEDVADAGRGQVLRLGDHFEVEADLLPILVSVATSSLLIANGSISAGESLQRLSRRIAGLLVDVVHGAFHPVELTAAVEIERSLAVGSGSSPPECAWALGHCWRELYPALVTRLSGHGPSEREWPAFHRLAGEMERLAFGPPPMNAAKMLALIDAGLVDLAYLRGATIVTKDDVTTLRTDHAAHEVDVVLDGVLPGPGVRGLCSELLGRLLVEGHARLLGGGRGLEVRFDGSCIGADGAITPGLAAAGRPTEDSVIGNDTLSRTLHPLADHWARRVVQRGCDASEARGVSPIMAREPA
jgi:diaminopimelate decarboxylase